MMCTLRARNAFDPASRLLSSGSIRASLLICGERICTSRSETPETREPDMALTTKAAAGLAGLLTLGAALAGCGGGSGSDGGTTITVWHGYTDVEAKAITAQVKQWNADHPDEKVKLVYNSGNDNALQKTVAGFTAGNYPDVAYEFGSSAAQLAHQPKLIDLTDTVKKADFNWDDFYPSE